MTGQRLELLRRLREARQKLLEARGSEYRPVIVAGESYSPAEAARYIAQHRTIDSWYHLNFSGYHVVECVVL